MRVPNERPTRAAIYLRQSLDATGDQLAVTRQRKACAQIAADRGWTVVGEFVDNSISASDKRKDRPGYNRLIEAFEGGEFDALIVWDLDRLSRQPRQLEDWVDAAEDHALLIVTANGDADLQTDGGRMYARIKLAVARAEVERKSARQRNAALQRSENGKPPLGVRLRGYSPAGELVPGEAAVVREMFQRFHAGSSLREIVTWLTEENIPARHGGRWNPSSVRTMLTNSRFCARAIYNGQTTGHVGGWEPIVDEGLFDTVQVKLSDPRRRTQHGTHRAHLGSGLYLCGICDQPVRSHSGGRYRCPDAHLTKVGASVDEFVIGVIRAKLADPLLGRVLVEPADGKGQDLAKEVARLRGRLATVEADYDAGNIDGRRFKTASAKITAELAAAVSAQGRAMSGQGVASTLTAPDPVAKFDGAPLGVRRAVLDFLMTVKLHPGLRGRKFDPLDGTVEIVWRQP